ncbi:alkene reductase [Pseudoflavitalea sp. G-6-1-2]|uniref:alkene reductase n=1 Tax=Pseudoflavitalea sp. G-6-1-2 TaxID=2728841 RepID=UPI00146DA963|nr:alkene reductase [Pseudoflavitalea sp. G-6-1-2]NML22193.1 alkene reductase [Pseudoflavitalea sp. G-6-1-2]
MSILLSPYQKNGLSLSNRMVMAPMTRNRAIGSIPNALMAEYYGQRATAGLIVTEGTSPAPEGLGYQRIPGIFTKEQVEGWKLVTDKVHANGGKIFVQLMHTGRVSHQDNLPAGAQVVGPSTIGMSGQIHTLNGAFNYSTPVALSAEAIKQTIKQHAIAAELAMEAGFDGVELHGAHGYLIEQFLNPHVNNRTDVYGGNHINRSRFAIETAIATIAAIGKERTAIRISPFSTLNDMHAYEEAEVDATYQYLVRELSKLELTYLHISRNPMTTPERLKFFRETFKGTIIVCNGFDAASAEQLLEEGTADLIGFGKPFLANADLPQRFAHQAPLNPVDFKTMYGNSAVGYTDYPLMNEMPQPQQ